MGFVQSVTGTVRRSGHRRGSRAARLLSAVAVLVLLGTAGCSGAKAGSASSSPSGSGAAASTPAPKEPLIKLESGSGSVSFLQPVKIVVSDGSFTSMRVDPAQGGGDELSGILSGDGLSWISTLPPKPSASYRAVATVRDSAGQESTRAVEFSVAKVPASQKVGFTVTPNAGETVGIGQPIVVRFLTPIKEQAAFEKVMTVQARTPTGHGVVGSWHWLNSQQVDWRPEKFWTPGTKVTLSMKIAGVKAAAGRYGRQDYSQTFSIGASHLTVVDAASHRVRVYRDGKQVDNWPTGTGRRGLETYSGTYIVLGKSQVVQMDSCSARVTCDKSNPDYYDEKEYWATRITSSGTFLHAASWDGLLGRANTSHGCIHLTDADARDFYNHAVDGDVVIVKNTGRGPQQRIATQDPGLYDWNLSWPAWRAGSALS